MLRAFPRNVWRSFSALCGVFPCSLHPDLYSEALVTELGPFLCRTLKDSSLSCSPVSVRLNPLLKHITSQWKVIYTLKYVLQAKIPNPYHHCTGNHQTKMGRGGNTCAVWHRLKWRTKSRKKKILIVLSCYLGALDGQNYFTKFCCVCLGGKSCRMSFCITVVLLNCSVCCVAGTREQGQKDGAQSGTFPPEPVLQEG